MVATKPTLTVWPASTLPHSYAEEGTYGTSVTIIDAGGSTASATSTATIADAALSAAGTAITGTEGAVIPATTVASFTDANPNAPASDFTATITWGDGVSSPGIVTANPSGGFNVAGSHTYADEGNYALSVAIADKGGSMTTATSMATVADADVLAAQAATVVINPNTWLSTVTANFSDSDTSNVAGDFSATVNWGDGTKTIGTLTDVNGALTVSGSHTYATAGQFPVTVTLADDSPGIASATAQAMANVDQDTTKDPAPTLTITSHSVSVNPGSSISLPVSVSGFDPDDAVRVKISNIPSWLVITDNLDGHAFGTGSATLTEAEINSGLVATSTYHGSGFPIDTLTMTASNTTLGESATSATQTITVSDPPAGGQATPSDGLHAINPALLGQYMASSFVTAGDSHGGTLITDPPPNQQSILTLPHS